MNCWHQSHQLTLSWHFRVQNKTIHRDFSLDSSYKHVSYPKELRLCKKFNKAELWNLEIVGQDNEMDREQFGIFPKGKKEMGKSASFLFYIIRF